MTALNGKVGLVIGIANDHSIAYGCARAFRDAGAELAATYLNGKAEGFVRPLAQQLGCSIIMPLDVTLPDQQEALFAAIQQRWGRLDFLLHSIAFAPKQDLQGAFLDCSATGFASAMDISCHSLVRLVRAAAPLMANGGSILTMSYYGAVKVEPGYNLMGPVKAALEGSVRYLAGELGERQIRVNALSPGPIMTRAASGLSHFDDLMMAAAGKAPLDQLATIDDVGAAAAWLVSDQARRVTGQVIYVDGGTSIVG
ncbi:MAG: enoyl-ACP reductase FabI [Alphaproteobacteria bacterium]|nr:enoyl-ACP reductase FabI [Alphaproteobacteria bacterium]